MHLQRLLLVVVICGVTVSASSVVPSSARAYHTQKERLLDTTAYSLDRREFRLGLMKLSYGIFNRLQVSTYTAPWLLGLALEELSPNIEFKSTLIKMRKFALSVSLGFVWGRVQACVPEFDEASDAPPCSQDDDFARVDYLIFPINVASSVRINSDVSVHIGGQYTATDVVGGAEPVENEVRGSAAVDMLQLYGMFEWRLSKVVALTLTTRWLPYVSDTVARVRLEVDDSTDANVSIQVDILENNAFAVIPGAVFSWERANLRLGVGYGAAFLEGLGLAIPASVLNYISPEFDVFVRF